MAIKDAVGVVAAVPTLPGVYRFYDAQNRLLYVGKAKNLKNRVASYFHQSRQAPRVAHMLAAAAAVDIIVTASEAEALLLENNLIKSLKPKYNILFRDDKSYPYLCLSRHAYPQLLYFRGNPEGKHDYYGPFPDSAAVRETIDILQRVFQLRNCSDAMFSTRTRPCLLHSIGRCSAPCTNRISPQDYAADVAQTRQFLRGGIISAENDIQGRMEAAAANEQYEAAAVLRDRLRALAVVRSRHFADNEAGKACPEADYIGMYQGDSGVCVNIIIVRGGRRIGEKRLFPDNASGSDAAQVLEALLSQYYRDRADVPPRLFIKPLPAHWREFAGLLQSHIVGKPGASDAARLVSAVENARLSLINRSNHQQWRLHRLELLTERLQLPRTPQVIHCFDISHSMGEETFAARVVFKAGQPYKRAYRLFRIRQGAAGDDYGAITEAVQRCYRGGQSDDLPDVLLIDGGIGQVGAAQAAFTGLSLPPPKLFGVAKGSARKPGQETIIAADATALHLPATDGALHLIQAVRDEAHRFALTAHRRRRDRKRGRSDKFSGIEGIGSAKRKLLLSYFGGWPAIQAASAAELAKIKGIGPVLAARIYQALHQSRS